MVKDEKVVAITTPVPGPDGQISKKTPIYHLPVYKFEMELANEETESKENEQNLDSKQVVSFHCDLADITDLLDKLRAFENSWRRSGWRK